TAVAHCHRARHQPFSAHARCYGSPSRPRLRRPHRPARTCSRTGRAAPMEKRISMRLLHILGLASLLWLTGCATTAPTDNAASTTDPATASHTPLYPSGPLQPITASAASGHTVAGVSAP